MSEYWQSTPRTWCKHCKTYYRATRLDETNHNASPRHQNAVQRVIKNLHKNNEREQREAQRAKDEIARLNGVVSGKPSTPAVKSAGNSSIAGGQATLEERKRQMAQLAAMGVAVPEQFRAEMAMAGEWETVRTRRVESKPVVKEEEGLDEDWERSFGVKRRRRSEEEDGPAGGGRGGVWGSRRKTYKNQGGEDVDIGALMGRRDSEEDKQEQSVKSEEPEASVKSEELEMPVKKEEDEGEVLSYGATPLAKIAEAPAPMKREITEAAAPVLFKKRKGKVKAGG